MSPRTKLNCQIVPPDLEDEGKGSGNSHLTPAESGVDLAAAFTTKFATVHLILLVYGSMNAAHVVAVR